MSESQQDPWGDMPSWSEGEAAPVTPAAAGSKPAHADHAVGTGDGGAGAGVAATCPWCATPAPDGGTRCRSCGAALAQRESIGDLVVSGLTAVDPALKDFENRPLHLSGPSPTQGAASGLIVAAAAGGPIGLAILGGVGALAAAEYIGAGGDKSKGHENVGRTSDAVLQAIERLERGDTLPMASDGAARPEVHAPPPGSGAQSRDPSDAPRSDDEEATDGAG